MFCFVDDKLTNRGIEDRKLWTHKSCRGNPASRTQGFPHATQGRKQQNRKLGNFNRKLGRSNDIYKCTKANFQGNQGKFQPRSKSIGTFDVVYL